MNIPRYAAELAGRLASMIDKVPDSVAVVQLAQPSTDDVRRRLDTLVGSVAEMTALRQSELKVRLEQSRTVLHGPAGTRAIGMHASGAMVVKLGVAPFDQLFQRDPGDAELTAMVAAAAERLALPRLLPDDEWLELEKLWRIKAAGSDQGGRRCEPVLCRVIGAYRHHVRGLPVHGRASATVELTGRGELASVSISLRRFAGDGGGKVVTETPVRPPDVAAADVAARMVKSFGELQELPGAELVAESFRFGYLSLGRRREQSLLAPFYLASIASHGQDDHSAHVIVVPGSEEQFVRLPTGQRSASTVRPSPALQPA